MYSNILLFKFIQVPLVTFAEKISLLYVFYMSYSLTLFFIQ